MADVSNFSVIEAWTRQRMLKISKGTARGGKSKEIISDDFIHALACY
jgi:hypothetical protein